VKTSDILFVKYLHIRTRIEVGSVDMILKANIESGTPNPRLVLIVLLQVLARRFNIVDSLIDKDITRTTSAL